MAFKRLRKRADYSEVSKIKWLTRLSTLGLILVFIVILGVIGLTVFFFTQIPSVEELQNRNVASATKIYDRNGELLYDIFQNQNRTPVKLSDIPDVVKKATISIEDKDFYKHGGFDVVGIARSFVKLVLTRHVEGGGSTLTQQLVKNALLTSDQS